MIFGSDIEKWWDSAIRQKKVISEKNQGLQYRVSHKGGMEPQGRDGIFQGRPEDFQLKSLNQ